MILEKRIYKTVEHYLYAHYEIAEQLKLEEEDIIHGCKAMHLGEETGASMSHNNSSKVEDAALKLIEFEENEESKWVNVINEVIKEFDGTEYQKLIDLTYNKQIRVTKILRLMSIEKSSYYEKRNDVIMQVALKAASKGLIDNKVKKDVS